MPATERSGPIRKTVTPKRKPHSLPPIPVPPSWREEIAALDDVGGELAISLWRALRRVRLWLDTAPERRKELFRPPRLRTQEEIAYACLRSPQLIEPFGTFSTLLRVPGKIGAEQVAEACRQVYTWAEGHSLLVTAGHFAEVAATVAPDDPSYANDAGWMCFRAGFYERAETWYNRGYGLAVRMRHHDLTVSRDQSIRSLLRLGIMLQTLGRHGDAKEYFDLASRRAARTGRRPLAAKANHDLMSYMAEVGTYNEAEGYASRALDLYAADAPGLPALALDYGYLLVRFSYFMYAVPLLQLCVLRSPFPEFQPLAWGTLARAAAGAGRRELFERAREEALSQVARHPEYSPAVFVHLGEGLRALGEWDEAESFAARALEAARDLQRPFAERVALNLLDQIAERQAAPPGRLPAQPDRAQRLIRRFMARLEKWKAPASAGADAGGTT